ncbi:MAG: nucleotidyltransferase domain-containing protein [Balneolaceae bacterium]
MILSDKHIAIIDNILKKNFSDCRILVFGSRVTNKSKQFSDLDLAVDHNGSPLPLLKLADAKQDFINSDLPYSVDLVDLNRVDEKFKSIILADSLEWPAQVTSMSS